MFRNIFIFCFLLTKFKIEPQLKLFPFQIKIQILRQVFGTGILFSIPQSAQDNEVEVHLVLFNDFTSYVSGEFGFKMWNLNFYQNCHQNTAYGYGA